MTEADRIARAQRWQQFYTEEGGIGDMIGAATMALAKEAASVEPWETDKLKKVAHGLRVLRMLDDQIKAVTNDGKALEAAAQFAAQASQVPERKRRWADFGGTI